MEIATATLITETVGAIAVVISFICLALQIRAQHTEARIATMQDISVGYRDSLGNFTDKQTACSLIRQSKSTIRSLARAGSIRLMAIVGRVFRVWEEAFIQHQAAHFEERTRQSMLRQFQGYMPALPYEKVWELSRNYFDPEFAEFVDSLEMTSYRFQ